MLFLNMEIFFKIVHWVAYAYFLYLFGYSSLFKVFQKESMMNGMQAFGFNKVWTLVIGYAELIGVLALITGLWFHQIKNASVLFLFLFAVGALMVHFAHQDYKHFYGAFLGRVVSVVLLATDKYFKILL